MSNTISLKFYLIRHGQSVNNATSSPEDYVIDAPLTDIGCQQAERVAEHLATGNSAQSLEFAPYALTHLYCSPMRRALETTRPIMDALGIPARVWVATHEHGGVLTRRAEVLVNLPGLNRAEMSAQFPGYLLPDEVTDSGWWTRTEDGLESIESCYERARTVGIELTQRAVDVAGAGEQERIALVTHGIFANGLIHSLFGLPLDDEYYYGHFNTGITRIDFIGPTPVLRYSNRAEHLPVELRT